MNARSLPASLCPSLICPLYAGEEKERLTLEAMQRGEPLIYSGRIQEPGLLGDPDLLRKETGGYVAGDIKSGSGEEGPEDDVITQAALRRPARALHRYSGTQGSFGRDAAPSSGTFTAEEVPYDFTALYGKRNPTNAMAGLSGLPRMRRRPSSPTYGPDARRL